MSNPYVGEIRMFGGNFAPAGWSTCDGQIMAITENETLFNLIGTTYGGDGQSTFALPNLNGRFPLHVGTDSTGNSYYIGQYAGASAVTLTTTQIPAHNHTVLGQTAPGNLTAPQGVLAASSEGQYAPAAGVATLLNSTPLDNQGGGQPHENMPPFLAVTYIISLFGIYPSQN
jgi:microcystin-dependent protein